MKRKHFLLAWILTILLTCAACTEAGAPDTNTGSAQTGTNQSAVSGTENSDSSIDASTGFTEENTTSSSNISTDSATGSPSDVTTPATDEPSNTDTTQTTTDTPSVSTSTQKPNTSTSTQKPNTSTSTQKPNTSTSTTTSSKPTVSTSTSNSGNGGTSNGGTPSDEPLHTISPEDYYGRTWLKSQANGSSLVSAYDQIVAGAKAMSSRVTFANSITVDQLYTVFHCYINDYPEHFWVDHNYSYTYSGNTAKTITLKYTMSATEKASAEKEFNRAVDNLLEGLHGDMDQFDLERILHDRLVLSITYKENNGHAHDAYGAIVEHTAVCEGYARAFQLLCRKVGIRALIAEGNSKDPNTGDTIGHAWNVVQINGNFYHIDVTWDDAGEPNDEHGIHYAWFNINFKQLSEDHILEDSGYDIPDCDHDEENFFLKTGRWLDKLTVEGFLSVLEKHGDEYHAHIYLKDASNAYNWFHANLWSIVSELDDFNYSYEFSMQSTGHGIYVIIKL